jgi:oligopeptide transport system substrate-binding protein
VKTDILTFMLQTLRKTGIALVLLAVPAGRVFADNPAALPQGQAAQQPPAQKTLRVRSLGEPMTLDWNRAYSVIDAELIRNVMEGLVTLDQSLRLTPALAKSWTVSVDGRIYLFELRKDVKWSDGTPLTAQHFVDSWKRLLSPITGSNYADLLFEIEGAEFFNKGAMSDFSNVGVKAIDANTLQIKLTGRSDPFLYNLAMWPTYPVRQDLIEQYGSAWEKPGNLVTLGAYRLVSHDSEQNIVLSRNPH